MPKKIDAYLEVGKKKVFAGALEWPGWCRSGPDESAALQAILDYGSRYKKAMGAAAKSLQVPSGVADFQVVERLKGNATTDFGAPGKIPSFDDEVIDAAEGNLLASFMKAAWKKFDKTAEQAEGIALRKGPRGGGREVDAIDIHVVEAEKSYLYGLGWKVQGIDKEEIRRAFVKAIEARARGEDPPPFKRRTAKFWTPRYAVRRAAWHVLDHAWEIEDRREA